MWFSCYILTAAHEFCYKYQSEASSHVIGWTNSRTSTRYMDFIESFNISQDLPTICYAHFSGC